MLPRRLRLRKSGDRRLLCRQSAYAECAFSTSGVSCLPFSAGNQLPPLNSGEFRGLRLVESALGLHQADSDL